MDERVFMIPGPTEIPPAVTAAASRSMVSHRSQDFREVFSALGAGLKPVFKTANDVLVLTCSGTALLEAAVLNFLAPGSKVLYLSAGHFGRRWRDIALTYGLEVEYIEAQPGRAVDASVVAERLCADREQQIKAVMFQQHETGTGVYNPLAEIAAARGGHPALLMADAISGLGACPCDTDAWGLDIVVASSQKALMTPPGLAAISVSERAWQAGKSVNNPKFYLDLYKAKKYADDGQTPFTPAVSLVYALEQAVRMLNAAGIDNVVAEHYRRRDALRAAVRALGLQPVAEDDCAGGALCAVYTPPGVTPPALRKALSERGVLAAGGMGDIKDSSFRMAHLGYIHDRQLIAAAEALEQSLAQLGQPVQRGCAAAAARAVLQAEPQRVCWE
ncbi:MAG: alanine--glyoxylate aminotransferase family protein [Bacillota bacterium]|nr:alanine--glyoxylate aminotransferase family protein [Bacillota bacterium]